MKDIAPSQVYEAIRAEIEALHAKCVALGVPMLICAQVPYEAQTPDEPNAQLITTAYCPPDRVPSTSLKLARMLLTGRITPIRIDPTKMVPTGKGGDA